jgi:DNA-binding response OmpR family regulator
METLTVLPQNNEAKVQQWTRMKMEEKRRLLIVEDEEAIAQGLADVFQFHGFEVDLAHDGAAGLEKALSGTYDLILLDVMLPSVDGFTICNEVRKKSKTQPIIMLTAKTAEEDIITGLTLGADDYVPKPFSVRQLVLRIEAVLRRSQVQEENLDEFLLGKTWKIDSRNLKGYRLDENGQPKEDVDFTRREIEILRYLSQHSKRPVSRDELLEHVWGYSSASNIETRTVDIHMAKLRKKIEDSPKDPRFLMTVRGEGYKINLSPS